MAKAKRSENVGEHSQENYIKLYELTQSTLIHEADRIWSRFTVYLTLNSAVLTLMALSVKDIVSGLGGYKFSAKVALAGIALSLIGLWLSYCWFRTTLAGASWQKFLIDHLSNLEKDISGANLWTTAKIRRDKKGHISIMRTTEWVNYCFIVVWLIVLVICTFRVCQFLCLMEKYIQPIITDIL